MTEIKNTGYNCWCGQDYWKVQFSIPNYQLLRCVNCGTYRNDPPPVFSMEESSDFYTKYYDTKKEYGTVLRSPKASRYWKVADKHLLTPIPDGNILDLGCGDGNLCNELKQNGWNNVVGIDVSKTRIQTAKNNYPDIKFYDQPLNETGISKNYFDIVVIDNVIEHIPEPQKFIENIREYIKPGGKLINITPNMDSGNFKLLGKRWTPELCPHAHIYLFTIPSINKMSVDAGFKVLNSGSFNQSLTGFTTFINRLLQKGPKAFAWKIMQESGSYYSRVIGQGEMLYNIIEKK